MKCTCRMEFLAYSILNGATAILVSCDWKYKHLWVVCLRLEDNLVVLLTV